MHRLIQDAIRQRHEHNRQYCECLIGHIDSRADFIYDNLERGNIPPECLWKIKLQPLGGMLKRVDFTQWAQKIVYFNSVLGDMLIIAGFLAGAEKFYGESLEIMRQLTGKDPGNVGWQRDITLSLDRIGDVLKTGGDMPGALKHYEESQEIKRRLNIA